MICPGVNRWEGSRCAPGRLVLLHADARGVWNSRQGQQERCSDVPAPRRSGSGHCTACGFCARRARCSHASGLVGSARQARRCLLAPWSRPLAMVALPAQQVPRACPACGRTTLRWASVGSGANLPAGATCRSTSVGCRCTVQALLPCVAVSCAGAGADTVASSCRRVVKPPPERSPGDGLAATRDLSVRGVGRKVRSSEQPEG